MKKFFKTSLVLLLALAMAVPALVIPSVADTATTYDAKIMDVKGGADAIVTLTYDDGVHKTATILDGLLEEHGLKATLMVVPSRIQGIAPYTSGYSTVAQLNELISTGRIDVQSHSYSHLYIAEESSPDYTPGNNTDANRQQEIVGSYNYLKENFPSVDPIAFAVPGGSYDSEIRDILEKTFYAVRNGKITSGNVQTLDPGFGRNDTNWHRLKCIWLSESQLASIKSYLDLCVERGGWFIGGCHNLFGTTIGTGNYDMTPETTAELFAYIKNYEKSGDVWVATFEEATKYIRERQNSTVKQYKNDLGMYVEVTMTEMTDDGFTLPEDIFDMPLTVKIEIPEGWANVRLSQKGKDTVVTSFTEGGKTYAYAEIVPNSGSVLVTNADEAKPTHTSFAELTMVKGGANSIATMTFDDGLVGTARALNELCAKYDCAATLIMLSYKINASNAEMWNLIFSEGYLQPDNHSKNHEYLDGSIPENMTEENIYDEVVASQQDFRKWFPDYDILTFGAPYSTYADPAAKKVAETHYAHRGNGGCVLITKGFEGRMQSLDPATEYTTLGGWYRPYTVRMMPEKAGAAAGYEKLTVENITGYLDQCVEQGGWFISAAHGIVDGENLDITIEDISKIMAKMQSYQNENKLWVATYTDATKYIRERQNSTVTATTSGDGLYTVNLTMADMTADGLPLDLELTNSDGTTRKVFSMPLTVKVEVPNGWENITYSQAGGDPVTVDTFTELGRTFAYIDLVPNGGEATFTSSSGGSLEDAAPEAPAGSYTAPEGAYVPANSAVTYAIFASEQDYLDGKTPVKEFTTTDMTIADTAVGGYIHVFADGITAEKLLSDDKTTAGKVVLDLGGKTLTLTSGVEVEAGEHLTIKNGTINNKGQMHVRTNADLVIENVRFMNNYATFGWGMQGNSIIFRNSKLEMNVAGSHFFLGSNDNSTEVADFRFINTDLVVSSGVSADYGLFRIVEQQGATARWRIAFDKDCTVTGNIPVWASLHESNLTEKDGSYQRFSTPQLILFEEGVIFSENARPDFTYKQIKLNDDNTNTTTTEKAPADDALFRMAVTKAGTFYEIDGEVVFEQKDSDYVIGVPNGTVDAPVGSYFKPEGVWEPDSSDITYAMWASETAYLNGRTPYKTFTSTVFDALDAGAGGYFVFFTDMTASLKVQPNANAHLTINLAGHKLTTSTGFGLASGSTFIIENGIVNNNGQLNLKFGTVIFDNLQFNHLSNGTFGYGICPVLWEMRDSVVTLDVANIYFLMGGNPITGSSSRISFVNTDLIVTKSTHADGFFQINATKGNENKPYIITFDKDSSFTGEITLLAKLTEKTDAVFGTAQQVIFEEGFTFNSTKVPAFEYLQTVRQGEEGSYTLSTPTKTAAGDDYLKVLIVAPGSTTQTEHEWAFENKDGSFVLNIYDPNETPDEPDEPDTPVDPDEPDEPDTPATWQPKADTTYAIWASKQDYIDGKAPIAEYNGNITIAALTSANTVYVRAFASTVTVGENLVLENGGTIVIDLDGKTFASAYGITIKAGTSFTLENGSYNHTYGQIYYAPVSYATYRNLTINYTTGSNLSYGYGCTELVYENCTVTVGNAANNFQLGANTNGTKCTLKIINTDFIVTKALVKPFFSIAEGSWNTNANWSIILDKDSSIGGTGTIPGLIGLYEGFRYVASGTSLHEMFVNTQSITIEDGFGFADKFLPFVNNYVFNEIDFDASVAAGTAVYKTAVTRSANDDICKIYFGNTLVGSESFYANPIPDTTLYSPSYSMDKANTGWYRYNAAGYWYGTLAKKNDAGKATFCAADFNKLGRGETILFAQDIVTTDRITGNSMDRTDIIFDLGGNTLTIAAKMGFNLSLWISGSNRELSLTWKNGTINCEVDQPFYGGGFESSVFTFENLTMNYGGSGLMSSIYLGKYIVKNCVINAEHGIAFGFEKATASTVIQGLNVENSQINAAIPFRIYVDGAKALTDKDFVVKNTVFNSPKYVIFLDNGTAPTESNAYSALFENCFINAPKVMNVSSSVPGSFTLTLDNTLLTSDELLSVDGTASAATDKWKVTYADGQTLMGIDGVEGYSYKVAKRPAVASGKLQANLTLYTDFQLNLFADPTLISGIYMNGEAITGTASGSMMRYSIPGISAANAADAIELVVYIKSGDVTYKVPVSYSVLAYANKVMATESISTLGKQLVTSAMEYVKAAYVYEGKTAPAFTGVALTAATAPATTAPALPELIAGARLSLGENLKLRFTLAEGKSGNLTVGDASYVVENGKVGELGYVEVDMRAYLFYDAEIVVSDGTTTGTYTLAHYVNAVKGDVNSTEVLETLVDAFYTYTKYASEYKKTGSLN